MARATARRARARGRAAGRARAAAPGAPGAAARGPLPSLVPETLEEMEGRTGANAAPAVSPREERVRRRRSLANLGTPGFGPFLAERGLGPLLDRARTATLQVNIGLYCNQACTHCHVESSPRRTEMMDRRTVDRLLELLRTSGAGVRTVDITGGAPELNANFRHLVEGARRLGKEVIDRCNLTVLMEPGQEDLPAFLADQGVRVVASMPCYSAANVDRQRGPGVFERSIMGLRLLNERGYGREGSGLTLDLVYNPGGAFLAPPQAKLEPAYKQELQEGYGIAFNSLLCLNNMPVKRFADQLHREGKLEEYMQLLLDSFNPGAVEGLMCRSLLSIGWDGAVYDCDFNQQLDMHIPREGAGGGSLTVFDLDDLDALAGRRIRTSSHCFGCTAGSGSSCGGATDAG